MNRQSFWIGFACGGASVIAGATVAGRFRRGGQSRILRLEKSVQIAAALQTVFDAWSDLPRLAEMSGIVTNVKSYGARSRWSVSINDVPFEWEAEITQLLPNEAIGWKSVSGPKHSGRITFSPIGDDTLVHVQMNYAPPARFLRRMLAPFSGDLQGYIEQVLRDVKAALERQAESGHPESSGQRAMGTRGLGPELVTDRQQSRFGSPSIPLETTRPPEAKS